LLAKAIYPEALPRHYFGHQKLGYEALDGLGTRAHMRAEMPVSRRITQIQSPQWTVPAAKM